MIMDLEWQLVVGPLRDLVRRPLGFVPGIHSFSGSANASLFFPRS